jgi:hypothetical protein
LNRSNESVSAAGERFYEARFLGRIAERRPKPFNRGVQAVVEIYEGIVRPESPLQFTAGHDCSRPRQHERQNFDGLAL